MDLHFFNKKVLKMEPIIKYSTDVQRLRLSSEAQRQLRHAEVPGSHSAHDRHMSTGFFFVTSRSSPHSLRKDTLIN